jgi:uncharacterized membrane protein YciS (DUF1049 family)
MRKYICLAIIFWSSLLSFGQLKNPIVEYDSLMKILPSLEHDTERIDVFYKIAPALMAINPNKCISFLNEAVALSQKNNDEKRLTEGMIKLGYVYSGNGETAKSIDILQKVIRMSKKNDTKTTATAMGFISLAYQNQGDLVNALKYSTSAHNMLAERRKKRDYSDEMVGNPMRIAEIYLLLGKVDSAFYYIQESSTIMNAYNMSNRYFHFHVPLLLAKIHLKRKETTLAYDFILEANKNAHNLNDNIGIAEVDLEFANYFKQINQPDSTILYAQSALKNAQELKRYAIILDAGALLKTWYQEHNDPIKALYYNDIAIAAKDSMGSAEKIREGQRLLFKDEQYQNELNAAKTTYQNRLIQYILGAGFLIFSLIAGIFYLNYKRKQKENLLLTNEIKLQETEFQSKLAETEMTALRAQMNPHFIFNCLNSIKLFTLQNNADAASNYLTKFSKLIRLVLENSRSEKVTLENELTMLQLYMEMEAMRFNEKLQFKINVDEDIDAHFIQIPPLLLQPYIENAIWHGLMHKEEGGTVLLDLIMKNDNMLQVSITDDGIGRTAAAALKSKSATKNKSFGLKMTSERIDLINQLYKSDTQVRIEDLVDATGNAVGTKVIIDISV